MLTKNRFSYAGTLDATRVDLSARLPTNIAQVLVRKEPPVTLGQTLVTLSCEDMKINQKFIQSNFVRSERLYKSGSISQEVYDNALNKRDEINTKISWCESSLPD